MISVHACTFVIYSSVCDQTCDRGYQLDMSSCSCDLSNICLVTSSSTCENGGMCVLESPPDTFNCNCTGTRYTGTTCTGELGDT